MIKIIYAMNLLFLIGINSNEMNNQEIDINKKITNTQLSDFDFIIGRWKCDVKIRNEKNEYDENIATWTGKYILNGRAIEDEYYETDKEGTLIRHGTTIRLYNTEYGWSMKWIDALNSTWLDLGPPELGGVSISNTDISFKHYALDNQIVRITFFNITDNNFSWKADLSMDNGITWNENVMMIETTRIE